VQNSTNLSNKTALVAIDTQNLFYSVRDLYGPGARIDFRKLKDKAKQICGTEDVRCVAYLTHLKDELTSLVAALKKLGYEIRNKPIQKRANGEVVGSDVDMDIVVEIAMAWAHYKVVCVASGDGDFIPLYNELRKKGVKVIVLSFSNALNTELIRKVDNVVMLDDLILFQAPKPEEKVDDAPEEAVVADGEEIEVQMTNAELDEAPAAEDVVNEGE